MKFFVELQLWYKGETIRCSGCNKNIKYNGKVSIVNLLVTKEGKNACVDEAYCERCYAELQNMKKELKRRNRKK